MDNFLISIYYCDMCGFWSYGAGYHEEIDTYDSDGDLESVDLVHHDIRKEHPHPIKRKAFNDIQSYLDFLTKLHSLSRREELI